MKIGFLGPQNVGIVAKENFRMTVLYQKITHYGL